MSQTRTYTVTGMTCGHCVASVTEEVQEMPGVENVVIDLPTGAVAITSAEPLDDDAVRAAVNSAGYELSEGADDLTTTYSPLPDGAELRFTTNSADLVDALHDWADAQVSDHGSHASHR